MARGIMLVFTDPKSESAEHVYNDWYDNTHLKEVLQVKGFTAAARFRRVNPPAGPNEPQQNYLAVYEVEADSFDDAMNELTSATGSMDLGDSLKLDPPPQIIFYEEITERRTS